MISRKDIMFMRHDEERQLIGFCYEVVDSTREERDSEKDCFLAEWKKLDGVGIWEMRIILDKVKGSESQVYRVQYQLPRDGLPMELIAATGLRYFQECLKEEIQAKSNYDFVLGELLRDM